MFDAPSPSRTAPTLFSNYVQPNFGHGLRIWWAFYWPTTLIASIMTFALNFSLRRLYEDSNVSANLIGPIMKIDSYVLTYAVALFVMDYILQKNFRHFRIALLTNHGGEGAEELDSTLGRALRVWWTYSWRTLFYLAIAWIVVILPLSWFVGIFKPRPAFANIFFFVVGFIIGVAVGLYAIYSNILDEDFGEFRVCLLPLQKEVVSPVAPAATPAQT